MQGVELIELIGQGRLVLDGRRRGRRTASLLALEITDSGFVPSLLG